MRVVGGVVCLAAILVVGWLGVVGVRHPEMSFWRHPILLSPFARLGWGLGSAVLIVLLAFLAVDVIWG